jgi:hypothetical protein
MQAHTQVIIILVIIIIPVITPVIIQVIITAIILAIMPAIMPVIIIQAITQVIIQVILQVITHRLHIHWTISKTRLLLATVITLAMACADTPQCASLAAWPMY